MVEPADGYVFAPIGSNVELRCETNGTDDVTWTIPDYLQCFIKTMSGPSLTINMIAPVYTGEYTCSTASGNVTDSRTFSIYVTGTTLSFLPMTFSCSLDYLNEI